MKNMKKTFALLLALCMVCSLAACGGSDTSGGSNASGQEGTEVQAVEIIVFAAASMQETLTKIIENYRAAAPSVTVIPTFDSSGTLLKQIKEGAGCDLFISAAQTQMNALDGSLIGDTEKNPDGLDYVLQGSRIDLLENKVALVVPEGNPAGIESFRDLTGDFRSG